MKEKNIKELKLDDDDKNILKVVIKMHELEDTEKLQLKDERFTLLNFNHVARICGNDWDFEKMKKRFQTYLNAGFFKRYIKRIKGKGSDKPSYKAFIYPTDKLLNLKEEIEYKSDIE